MVEITILCQWISFQSAHLEYTDTTKTDYSSYEKGLGLNASLFQACFQLGVPNWHTRMLGWLVLALSTLTDSALN